MSNINTEGLLHKMIQNFAYNYINSKLKIKLIYHQHCEYKEFHTPLNAEAM
jgi:hypothetical protein